MPKAFDTWTLLPHGPIEKLADNLWRLEGTMPNGTTRRVMTLARLTDGRVIIHNAIALEEELMNEITAWGTPAAILVPNGFHRQDARIMKARFPAAKVYCPTGAKKAVSQVISVDGSFDDVPRDSTVHARHLEGVKAREGLLDVSSSDGRTIVFCDTILNLSKVPFPIRLLLAPIGRPSVPRFARWFFASDKPALRRDLEHLASASDVRRLIPGHGAPILTDAQAALRTAAATLG
jgi:hypothetical protein